MEQRKDEGVPLVIEAGDLDRGKVLYEFAANSEWTILQLAKALAIVGQCLKDEFGLFLAFPDDIDLSDLDLDVEEAGGLN